MSNKVYRVTHACGHTWTYPERDGLTDEQKRRMARQVCAECQEDWMDVQKRAAQERQA